jgi:hypothetical protein
LSLFDKRSQPRLQLRRDPVAVHTVVTTTDATPSSQPEPAAPVRKKPSAGRELKPPGWFEDRLAAWVRRLGLAAWTIRPSYKPRLRGAEGYAKVTPTFLEAELEFRQDVLVERGDVVIVHELTHILTDEWADAMQQVIRDMVPRKLQREARDFLRPHEEAVVEAIAHALVRTADEESPRRSNETPAAQIAAELPTDPQRS